MFRKTYLSIAASRAWSADHPVGDPYGGPAYGEKRMPAIAVVAAVVAAGEVAAVGFAAMTMFECVAAVGAMTAGVGAITGNKALMQIGGAMSLVGGVGSLASSLSSTETLAPVVDGVGQSAESAVAEQSAIESAKNATSAGMEGVVDNAAPAVNTAADATAQSGLASDINSGNSALNSGQASGINAPSSAGASPVATGVTDKTSALASSTPEAGSFADSMQQRLSDGATQSGVTESFGPPSDLAPGEFGPPKDLMGSSNVLSKFGSDAMSWMKDNKVATEIIGKGIMGVGETFTDQYKLKNDYLKSNSAYSQAKAAETNQQMANAAYVPSVANYFAPTPSANIYAGQPAKRAAPGLINTAKA